MEPQNRGRDLLNILRNPKVSRTKIPTQAELRALAHSVNSHNLVDLGLIDDENENLNPAEILTKFRNASREKRDEIFELAAGFEMGMNMDDDMDIDTDEDIDLATNAETQTFTLFNELPTELRAKIWRHAAETNNLIEITWKEREECWWATSYSRVSPPAVFSACRDSREATRLIREKEMMKAFGTWTNIYTDLLFLRSLNNTLPRRFMNFAMDLYEAWEIEDDDIDEELKETVLSKLPRLAVCWNMWTRMLDNEDGDDLTVGGQNGLLKENFPALKELVFVYVVEPDDQERRLYRDDRVLVEDELFQTEAENNGLKMAREDLNYEPGECEVVLKSLLRGDDGEGGVRAEYRSSNPVLFDLVSQVFAS